MVKKSLLALTDLVCSPLTVVSSLWLKFIRRAGVHRMKISRAIFNRIGLFPIRDHYYEPLFNPAHLRKELDAERHLPALDMNESEQLALLDQFNFQSELLNFPLERPRDGGFFYGNVNFGPGDSEYLYSVIRFFKPRRIVEIGSGYSTLMVDAALSRNKGEDLNYTCAHQCIEPYEMPWLAGLEDVSVLRSKVEDLPLSEFRKLQANDVLFIDSSHCVRPQGDVLFNFFEILPILQPGVLIHIHDIFTPRDYLREWVIDRVRFWNEQYLLEAFLSFNRDFKVIGALNFLMHHHQERLLDKLPVLKSNLHREPGSFWIQRMKQDS